MTARLVVVLFVSLYSIINLSIADEGMWPYNNIPREQLRAKYGFEPTQEWLDHMMKSSVRFNSGGSGSFISSDGLVLTNHHVAADILHKKSTPERDLYKNGFYARTQAEEIPAPDLELNALVAITDMTARVNSAVQPGMDAGAAYKAKQAMISQIEKEYTDASGLRSDIVTLYNGGAYHLYQYKKYTDVRVVFAPEFSMAFFGGDPDNFEYPRYDLDMTIFRVYENGRPAQIEHFFRWSAAGVADNDLVFVSGHPGSTSRLFTSSALEFLRDVMIPYRVDDLEARNRALLEYSTLGEEQARQAKEELFYIQNSLKVFIGRAYGLINGTIIADKKGFEENLKGRIISQRPELQGNLVAWANIQQAQDAYKVLFKDYMVLEGRKASSIFGSDLFMIARHLVRMAAEDQKPNSERLPEYKESARASLERTIYSDAPLYPEFEKFKYEKVFERLIEVMGPQNPTTKLLLAGLKPKSRAYELITHTKLFSPQYRRELAAKGQAGIDESHDPMILLAKAMDESARRVRTAYEERVAGVEQQAYPMIAQSIFALDGSNVYPDATFTLRLSFGQVKGYEDSSRGGTLAPWTTIGGAFHHELNHGAKHPWMLPMSWHSKIHDLNLNTPLNFVSTADIIGGNSGSPVLNRAGEIVGLIFDGNIYSLVGDYGYEDRMNRSISVDARGMMEALRVVYGAGALADQIGR
jgi:hypothetical protein